MMVKVGDKFTCVESMRHGSLSFTDDGTQGYLAINEGESGTIVRADYPKRKYHYQFTIKMDNENEWPVDQARIDRFFIPDNYNVVLLCNYR